MVLMYPVSSFLKTVEDLGADVLYQGFFEDHHIYTKDEITDIFEGSFGTDIGKTGPKEASPELSKLIAKLYGIKKAIPSDLLFYHAQKIAGQDGVKLLKDLNFSDTSTMRDLYDIHVYWSYDLIKDSGLSERAKLAAAAHHILDGKDGNYPRELFDETGMILSGEFAGQYIGRVELLVMLLDKYDARRTRGKVSHEEAITWLRTLKNWNTYKKLNVQVQQKFEGLIDDLEDALSTTAEGDEGTGYQTAA